MRRVRYAGISPVKHSIRKCSDCVLLPFQCVQIPNQQQGSEHKVFMIPVLDGENECVTISVTESYFCSFRCDLPETFLKF